MTTYQQEKNRLLKAEIKLLKHYQDIIILIDKIEPNALITKYDRATLQQARQHIQNYAVYTQLIVNALLPDTEGKQ